MGTTVDERTKRANRARRRAWAGVFMLALSALAIGASLAGAHGRARRAHTAVSAPVNLEGSYVITTAEQGPCSANPRSLNETLIIWDWSRSGSFDGEATLPGGRNISVSGVETKGTTNAFDGLPHISMTDPTGQTGGVLNGEVGAQPETGAGTGDINLWDPIPCYPNGYWLSMDRTGPVPRGVGGKVTMRCAASCSANGEPLFDVPVTVKGRRTYHVRTAEDGTYWVRTTKGRYVVTPHLRGFVFAPSHRSASVNRPVTSVDFITGCSVRGTAVASAASAASVWNLLGGGNSCPNKVGVHYTPSSNQLVVAWVANVFRCTVDGYFFDNPALARYIIPKGHVVGLQPGDRVSRTKNRGVSATVNSNGSLAMQISISPMGKDGTADLSSPLVITYNNQNGAPVSCSPVRETLDLSP